MLKKSKGKKKRALFLLWTASFLTCFMVYVLSTNINLVANIFPFLSSTTNNKSTFYGENIDMSQILPGSQHYVINNKGEDLIDIAANLGVNFIRITNAQRSFNNHLDSVYTKSQWNQVLNKMQRKGIKALILIEIDSSDKNYYTPDIHPVYLHLVQEYIDSEVFSNPDVYAVDLKNEPLLTDANIHMLQFAHGMIQAKYPHLKQTIGWWASITSSKDPHNPNNYNWSDFSAGKKIAPIVDFYSIHMYGLNTNNFGIHLGADLKTKVFLSQVENGLQTRKPILIEEFGEANGDAISDQGTIGGPEVQANVYQGVYQALREMHSSQIMGSVAFDFYSRNQYPDAWAIVKNNGNYLFPAAHILQAYASGKNISSLETTSVVTSQSYLVKNASNHTAENLHIADRIGFKLQLDNSKDYSIFLNVQGLLHPIELFHYDTVSDSYYALYQATNKGSVQLNIIPHSSDTIYGAHPNTIYTLTINIS